MPYGRVLIETGAVGALQLPAFAETGRLIANMRAAGKDPCSIQHILLTHAHVGHGTGLVDGDGNKLYPNAKVYISQEDHEFWFASPPRLNGTDFPPEQQDLFETFAMLYRKNIIPYLDDLIFLQDNDNPLPGIEVILTPGHSPGHVVFNVTSDEQSMLVIGDVWFTKPDQVQNPEWTFDLDTDRHAAYESRIRVMDMALKHSSLVLAFHEAFPGLGHIKSDGAFFDWEPMVGQNVGVGIELK
ncbi:Metallo-beta-lactamase [Gracilaria domingensis]|nr:Metallo-beta-lactamase [Gracilaria domingensis]